MQASVHAATLRLLARAGRAEVTVPLIAAEAGVTPSTIYRRWGDLGELLADVAVARLHPEGEPVDTGSARGDLRAFAEQYAEEMSSGPGRAMIRDVLAAQDGACAGQCWLHTRGLVEAIARRAAARGEAFPAVETVMDGVVAPILGRILFDRAPGADHVAALIAATMAPPPTSGG